MTKPLSPAELKAHAEILGVGPGASAGEVKAAWRKAAREKHPDRNAGTSVEEMARINAAYDALRNGVPAWVSMSRLDRPSREATRSDLMLREGVYNIRMSIREHLVRLVRQHVLETGEWQPGVIDRLAMSLEGRLQGFSHEPSRLHFPAAVHYTGLHAKLIYRSRLRRGKNFVITPFISINSDATLGIQNTRPFAAITFLEKGKPHPRILRFSHTNFLIGMPDVSAYGEFA